MSPSRSAANIIPADPKDVVSCKLLGAVEGSSGWGNIAASAGMENAKTEALERASQLGATHIVWTNIAGGYAPYATAKAYRCS